MGFKKDGGFGGGQGGPRKSFGGARFGGKKQFGQGGGGQKEMFSATCANCRKACEVPFKPSGDRPVYCRDCFGGKTDAPRGNDFGGRRDDRGPRKFEPRDRMPAFGPHQKPVSDEKRFDEMKRQIDAVHNKLDIIQKMIEGRAPAAPAVIEEAAPEKPAKTKKAAKKAAKK